MIQLELKEVPSVPLEAEALCPDRMAGLDSDALRALPVFLGKRQRRLDDFFSVTVAEGAEGAGAGADDAIELVGDLAKVKCIGRAMSRGRITVRGNAGMHLGAYMTGGAIEVTGNAADWVGAEMTGGTIRVRGNAGGQIGAAYRGSLEGMRGGTIVIDGSVGLEVGMRMRRGLIAVRGMARDFVGLQMKGGTILLGGGAELRTGAWMKRGTIISLGPLPLLPTFLPACAYDPTFTRVFSRRLEGLLGWPLPFGAAGRYERFTGDTAVPGKGEILIWRHSGECKPSRVD